MTYSGALVRLKNLLPLLLLLSSCGYRFNECGEPTEKHADAVTITIPYIKGDPQGHLNNALVELLTASTEFEYKQNDGSLLLEVNIMADSADIIGYRRDRNPTTGAIRPNVLGTENRRTVTASVTLIDTYTNEQLVGPVKVSADADYDYVETSSIRDLTFTTPGPGGSPQTVIAFSLGQLDSIEGAADDVTIPLYHRLAEKIVEGICNQNWNTTEDPKSNPTPSE